MQKIADGRILHSMHAQWKRSQIAVQ